MSITPEKLEKFFKMKLAAECGPHGIKAIQEATKGKATVLDVRRAEDFKAGHIAGAMNIPLGELEKRYKEISKKNQVIAYCYSITCFAAPKAALFLAKKGYLVTELVGGFEEYKKAGMAVSASKSFKAEAVAPKEAVAA